jgi:hypothetical protein
MIQHNQKPLYYADSQGAKTLTLLSEEAKTDVYLHPTECTDFIIDPISGQLVTHIKTICINGVPWHLTAGPNQVPLSVAKILTESRHYKNLAEKPHKKHCLTQL